MLHNYLREHTRAMHDRVERRLDLLRPDLTRLEYLHTLQRLYGFYHPLEARLLALKEWSALGMTLEERRKVPLLEADLLSLGMTGALLDALPRCQDLPRVVTLAQGLGCLYVVEGATLGGQVLTHYFQRQVPKQSWSFSFLSGYGDQTGGMWKAFVEQATSYATIPAIKQSILASATETFLSLERWL